MNWHQERATRNEAKALVAEAEATLTGRLIDRHWWDEKLPPWMWLNKLAHADWVTIKELSDGSRPRRGSVWDGAATFLAGELLSAAGSPEGLVELQEAQLIPLEADLLGASWTPSVPAQLVNLVRTELMRFRARQVRQVADERQSNSR